MKKGILSLLTLIFILSVLSSMSFASTLPDKEEVRYDKLLALSPSIFAASNYFAAVETTCKSGSSTPKFKPGQVVSSDVFNEIFSRIDYVTEGFKSSAEIVGIWNCTVISTRPACYITSFYTKDSLTGLFATFEDTVTFSDNGNGTYSYATANYPISSCRKTDGTPAVATPETGIYVILSKYIPRSSDSNSLKHI